MCQMKSAIILKDRVFIPDYDSHREMLEELKIKDTEENARRLFVRAELVPQDGDIFSDVSGWKYRVDQDILPKWYAAEVDEKRMREAVQAWVKEHVHIGKTDLDVQSGKHWVKDCTVKAYNNSTVEAYNNSTVEAYNDSTVKAYDYSAVTACNNSTVTAYDYSTVEAYDNSTVTAYNNSTVEAYDNSTVKAYNNSTVTACNNSTVVILETSLAKKYNVSLFDNATLKDCKTKKIYQAGDWEFEKV